MTRIALSALLAASLLAQAPAPSAPPPRATRQPAAGQPPGRGGRTNNNQTPAQQGPLGSIRGQVLSTSGEAIRKAEVVVSGADNFSTVSDANGYFSLTQVPAGSYTVGARRPGYARDRGKAASITVASGQDASGVIVRLSPQATIIGKVVDEDGDVVMDANVQVLRESWQKGRKTISPVQVANVNDLGEFRVAALNSGKYYLSVTPGRRSRPDAPPSGYAQMYYPGVFDPAQALGTELSPGQELRLDMRLRRSATYSIKGRIVDADAAAQSRGVAVVAVQDSPTGLFLNGNHVARVRQDGWFEIAGLTPGTFRVQAARMDRGGGARASATVQLGNRDVENLVLQLQPPVKAPYSVRVDGDTTFDVRDVRVQVETEPGSDMGGGGNRAEAGTVTLPATGKIRLAVQGVPDGTFVKSIRLGSLDVTNGYFDAGSGAGAIEVLLSKAAGQATGTVQTEDAKPMGGAFVVLAPSAEKRAEFWNYRFATASDSGTFTLKNVPPGTYVAFALRDSHDGAYQDPEFLKSIESKGVRVNLSENGTETLSLKPAE